VTHKNLKFENCTVELDGSSFEGCSITGCTLNYRGGDMPKFDSCSISRCNLVLLDSALRSRFTTCITTFAAFIKPFESLPPWPLA